MLPCHHSQNKLALGIEETRKLTINQEVNEGGGKRGSGDRKRLSRKERGRKEGRKEEREEGRKEGRKERREGGKKRGKEAATKGATRKGREKGGNRKSTCRWKKEENEILSCVYHDKG